MSGDPTATVAGPWPEQKQLRPALLHFRSVDVLSSINHMASPTGDTSTIEPHATVRPSLSHSNSTHFSRLPKCSRVSQGCRIHRTDPELSRKESKSTLSVSTEHASISTPVHPTRQHPYVRPPSRANSRDTGPFKHLPERSHSWVLLDDWASCSSDGLPSLPTSPSWARAEEQAWSQARHEPSSDRDRSNHGPHGGSGQLHPRSYSHPDYPGDSSTHQMPLVRSRTTEEPMHTSSLHTENAASTMKMIQQLNLESSSDVSHRASHPLFQDRARITSSPEPGEQSEAHLHEFEYASEAHRPDFSVHATKTPEDSLSSLDMDLSVEDMMEHDSKDSGLLCCSSSYQSDREIPSEDLLSAGDRVGPGLYHDGELIRIAPTCDGSDAQDSFDKPLEVVKLLGQGSYAIVYLVREVSLSETAAAVGTDFDASTTPCAPTQSHPFSPSKTPVQHNPAWPRKEYTSPTEETPYYALKCLSKRNLTPEQAFLQQHELTIHQSIPPHPNIVTMHGAYETTDWLFLVLEYCPGKDLYFWLEEANDASSMLSSITILDRLAPSQDSTDSPDASLEPDTSTPWLLSSTSPEALLSARRLQLVSAIFQQMCHAVQFCHDLGISHRDIKPENFIVEDRRGSSGQPDDDVIVKLTDFGLATSAELSRDFNCGSKPYMAFECRHDLSSYYDPKQSDTWSLGVVLLNLIFHRSPFKDASAKHCASFAAFSYKPILFLMQAFDGMTEEMAHFLNDNVFCDVSDGQRRRITPLAFGHWAKGLSHMLQRRTSPFTHSNLFPMVSSVNLPHAESDDQHHADSPLSDTLGASSHGLRNYMSLTNHPTVHGGVSSFPEPSLDSLPDGAMSGSLSLSRSSAPFHSAVP